MKLVLLLVVIFFLAAGLRFLYFPQNIYFGYDQARDMYAALSLLQGDFKIVGPPSSFNEQLFHGPLIYYIYAPVLWLFSANLEAVSFSFRILNALGVVLVFLIGQTLFSKRAGLLAAFLFSISYEQSQYALFLGHPALAVIPVLAFYLGLVLVIFKQEWKGLLLSAVSLGLAMQFHYVHVLLVFGLIALLITFRSEVKSALSFKRTLLVLGGFFLSVSTFLLSEVKYGFRLASAVSSILGSYSRQGSLGSWGDLGNLGYGGEIVQRFIFHNFVPDLRLSLMVIVLVLTFLVGLLVNVQYRKKAIFLIVWLFAGILPYVLTKSPSYYYGAGSSVSLLILAALTMERLWIKFPLAVLILLTIVTFSNLNMAVNLNKKGPNLDMVIQPQMLLSDEKRVIDYIYEKNKNGNLAVRALTIPLSVNTTWSYLFEWYGKERYGYLPTWIGPNALGYAGNLKVENSRSNLPQTQFLIIEPTVGIRQGYVDSFFEDENYFTNLVEEKEFGQFTVQLRQRF